MLASDFACNPNCLYETIKVAQGQILKEDCFNAFDFTAGESLWVPKSNF